MLICIALGQNTSVLNIRGTCPDFQICSGMRNLWHQNLLVQLIYGKYLIRYHFTAMLKVCPAI